MRAGHNLATAGLLLLLLAGSLSAQMTHNPSPGSALPDDDESIYANGFGSVIQEPAAPAQRGEKPAHADEKTPAKGGEKQVPVDSGPAHYPVFLFADGPSRTRAVFPPYWKQTELLIALVRAKVPGAVILRVRPLSLDRLRNAWRDAQARRLASEGEVSSLLVIFNAETSPAQGGELRLLTTDGYVQEAPLRAALQKLGKTISDELKPETVLLTSRAGAIDCGRFPGPVFGMTPSSGRRNLPELNLWLRYQINKHEALFPTTAREFYEDWANTNHLSRRRYFFCPYENGKGYLGYKTARDPLRDNGGVGWKIE